MFNILYWDLDDTLIKTQSCYNKVNEDTALLVEKKLNNVLSLKEIKEVFDKIDKGNISKYGFSKERMPNSWLDTYNLLANNKGIAVSKQDEEEIYQSGNSIFEMSIPLYEDSLDAIKDIKEKGYEIHILTLGDKEIQEKRIRDTNLAKHFNDIHIVSEKTPEMYRKVAGVNDLSKSVMIGNSLRSDIYPALENDMFAIHVNRESWVHDQYDVDKSNPKYRFIEDLTQLKKSLTTLI